MRISNVVIALACVLLLTDCGRIQDQKKETLENWKKFYKNAPQGYHGDSRSRILKPPGMESKIVGPKPVQQEPLIPLVMKPTPKPLFTAAASPPPEPPAPPPPPPPPPTPQLVIPPSPPSPHLAWTEIGFYDAANPSLPAKAKVAPPPEPRVLAIPVAYDDVTVFPVDGDTKPYARLQYDFTKPDGGCPAPESDVVSGQSVPGNMKLAQQIFFGYGLSKVDAPSRQGLKKLASDVMQRDTVRLNVIGHASKRVDHVEDPIARKMINFKMAQKRADAVTNVLHQEGVRPDWIMAISKGDEMPNPDPGMKPQEEADRRVEVYIDPPSMNISAAW
jgi:outer membrane protein OmpA-like peptidoglycan-associated protein